ncbi:transglycosylase domain-containing protein [Nonomuraea sp. NPDC049152]|uniref:transglycosylase domain-containing protein n=1 Tax=Nonomuraea sp. NPDC049152 TaxID=3154350 RepID=UPI0033C6322B
MPASQPPQTGWGSERRPEAAFEQTGAMDAQPPAPSRMQGPSGPQQMPPRQTAQYPTGGPATSTRRRSAEETMVGGPEARRSRGGRGPGGPEGPGRGGGGGGDGGGSGKGRRGWKRFIPNWKIVMAALVVLAAGMFGMIWVAYAGTPLPRVTQESAIAQESVIYYRDGKTEIGRWGTPRRIIPLSDVNDAVKDATIAIENKTFYEDSGISIPGMVRSVWMTATGQQVQGASTITQQMARNYYQGLSQEQSIARKVKEIFVAVKLNKEYSKEKILEDYLNTINYGRAYGIQAAAEAYFGKGAKAKKLTSEQAAYLAARIQQPNWDMEDPRLKTRWATVIKYMSEQFPTKYGQLPATAKWPKIKKPSEKDELAGLKGYMIKEVLNELEGRGYSNDLVERGGFKIISTFDKQLMLDAKKAAEDVAGRMDTEYHVGLASVDNKTGRVLAFYGGKNYLTDPWNEPFKSYKQAASAFKPYVLAAWLDAGYSLSSYVPGNQTVPKKLPGEQPGGFRNSHNVGQAVDIVKATAASVNTAYVSMAYKLPGQLEAVQRIVEEAGFGKKRMADDIKAHGYGFSIGSALVSPVEQAAGYSIFANGGKHTDYHVVQKIIKPSQKVDFDDNRLTPRQVISAEAAADATVAMQAVLRPGGTANGKGLGSRPAAGKTGTNNNEKEAWFVGYTPQISTAVGFYREECKTASGKVVQPQHSNCPTTDGKKNSKYDGVTKVYTQPFEKPLGFEGAGPPTEVWRAYMLAAHETLKLPIEPFPTRANIGQANNIVEKPKPTPTPTTDNPFGTPEDPFGDNNDCGLLGCGDNDSDNSGLPEDGTTEADRLGEVGTGEDPMGGGAVVPDPMARPTRTDDE